MRQLLSFVLLLSLCQCSASRLSTSDTADTANNYRLFLDPLAQMYTVAPNNTIVKYNKQGKEVFEYSDNTLGRISVFDVGNPLQLLVFHRDFQVVKIFDRTLTESSRIDLNKLDLFEVRAVGSANDNRIWIFDELNQELLKIDKNGKVQGRNNDLRLRLNMAATPTRIIDYKNKVYLFDPNQGILIFNAFGEYLSKRAFSHLGEFNYFNGKLFYRSYSDLVTYNLEDGTQESNLFLEELLDEDAFYKIEQQIIYLSNNEVKFISSK